jgi:hypothetical protein
MGVSMTVIIPKRCRVFWRDTDLDIQQNPKDKGNILLKTVINTISDRQQLINTPSIILQRLKENTHLPGFQDKIQEYK